MRIVCPSCQSAYDVPASVIDAGRILRCARCAADFTPLPPVPEPQGYVSLAPVIDASVEPITAAPALRLPVARARTGNAMLVLAWVASFMVLAAAGWAFVAWRAPIQRAWPASARIYLMLGYRA